MRAHCVPHKKKQGKTDLIGAWVQRGPESFADLLYSALQLFTYIDQYLKTIYIEQHRHSQVLYTLIKSPLHTTTLVTS